MNNLDDLIFSLRPDAEEAYRRRCESDLARVLATPRRRTILPRLRLLAVAVPVVAAGAVATVVLAPTTPMTATAPPEDRTTRISSLEQALLVGADEGPAIGVFLCKQDDAFPVCDGRAATKEQKASVEKTLAGMPGVDGVTLIDRVTAYDHFRREMEKPGGNKAWLAVVTVDDIPESFRITMKRGADWRPVIETAEAMPGVSNVVQQKR
jgi:hypothetical protein